MDALLPLVKKDEQRKENNFDGGISNEAGVPIVFLILSLFIIYVTGKN